MKVVGPGRHPFEDREEFAGALTVARTRVHFVSRTASLRAAPRDTQRSLLEPLLEPPRIPHGLQRGSLFVSSCCM